MSSQGKKVCRVERVMVSMAQESFNIMLVGAVIGPVTGVVIGYVIGKK